MSINSFMLGDRIQLKDLDKVAFGIHKCIAYDCEVMYDFIVILHICLNRNVLIERLNSELNTRNLVCEAQNIFKDLKLKSYTNFQAHFYSPCDEDELNAEETLMEFAIDKGTTFLPAHLNLNMGGRITGVKRFSVYIKDSEWVKTEEFPCAIKKEDEYNEK